MMENEEGGVEIVYVYGRREVKTYALTEGELSAMAWWPGWLRRRLIRNIRSETKFDAPA